MDLDTARSLANEIRDKLLPLCGPRRCEIVGSIRRGRDLCGDVDIVLIPGNQGRLALALRALGSEIKSGPKLHACVYSGQHVDVYIATEQTWWTLMLIRTGSKEHNIKMCSQARSMGMTLHANGSGLTRDNGTLIQPSSEQDIFTCLKLPYKRPEERG